MSIPTMPNTRSGEYRVGNAQAHVAGSDIGTDRPCYVLFAGASLHPRGGLGDLVRTFACEEAARKAFHELRVQGTSKGAWAQLAMVDVRSGLRPVCWFGTGAAAKAPHVLGASTTVAGTSASTATGKRGWRERYRRHVRTAGVA